MAISRGPKYAHHQADKINYVDVIKRALAMESMHVYLDKEHNYLQGLHMSILREQKMMKQAGFLTNCNGVGRTSHLGTTMDTYILKRKSNLPELVFNQNRH